MKSFSTYSFKGKRFKHQLAQPLAPNPDHMDPVSIYVTLCSLTFYSAALFYRVTQLQVPVRMAFRGFAGELILFSSVYEDALWVGTRGWGCSGVCIERSFLCKQSMNCVLVSWPEKAHHGVISVHVVCGCFELALPPGAALPVKQSL